MSTQEICKGLRVLLVGAYPPPYGGVASHLTMLIPGLFARGAASVNVISFGARDEMRQVDGATIHHYHLRRHIRVLFSPRNWGMLARTFFTLGRANLGLRRLLEESVKAVLINKAADKYASEVVSFYQSDLSFALLPCSSYWGKKRGVILTILGELYDTPALLKKRKAFMERLLDKPLSVVSSSNHCACSFQKLLGISREVQSIYYGVDLKRFAVPNLREDFREKIEVAEEEVLLVFMGRFTEEMGIGRIIEIAPAILEQFPQVKFLLVGGKGPLLDTAADFVAQYSNRARMMNDVSFDLQPSIYAASDIVLAPSRDQHACMGMAIKEAMAAARPVIGTRAGGIPEAIVHEETGFLVSLDQTKQVDIAELRNIITRLILEPELRSSVGMAARLRAETIFTKERTMDRMGKVFMDAMPV